MCDMMNNPAPIDAAAPAPAPRGAGKPKAGQVAEPSN
jgi:hypothetical protein